MSASKPGGNSNEYVLSDSEYREVYRLADTGQLGYIETFYAMLVEQKNAQLGPRSLCPDPAYSSPLLAAARSGHLNVVKYLITHSAFETSANGKFCLNPTSSILYSTLQVRDLTPLGAACIHGHVDVMTYLLQSGADVNETDCFGFTPLCIAVGNGCCIEAVDFLLNNGADANHVSHCGYTAMHLPVVARYFRFREPERMQVVKCLLSHGALPHTPSSEGHIPCPLYLLAAAGDEELVHQITSSPTCPPECIADAFLLLGIAQQVSHRLGSMALNAVELWNTAFSTRDYHKLPVIGTPPLLSQMYWGRTEISSMDDFNRLRFMPNFQSYEFCCQSALIVERCLKGDPFTLMRIAGDFSKYGHFVEGMKLLTRAMQMNAEMVSAQLLQNSFCLQRALKIIALLLKAGELFNQVLKARGLPSFCWSSFLPYCLSIFACLRDLFRSEKSCSFTLDYRLFVQVAEILSSWLRNCESRKSESMECEEIGLAFVAVVDDLVPFMSPSYTSLGLCMASKMIHLPGMLRWGADRHINEPITQFGRRPIHLVHCGKLLSIMLSFGAHPDAVDKKGRVVDFAKYGITLGVPPLSCLACRAVVAKRIQYKYLHLPSQIKFLIRLHDRRAYSTSAGRTDGM